MQASLTPDGVCQTSRNLPFPRSQVFAAFANPEQLAAWWGPEGFTNTFEVFEFNNQGRWKFVMHGPDGAHYPNECLFQEVSATKIVIRHIGAPDFTLTITLADLDRTTSLHWHQAFDDAAVAARIEHIIVPANEQNLDRLAALLAKGMTLGAG